MKETIDISPGIVEEEGGYEIEHKYKNGNSIQVAA